MDLTGGPHLSASTREGSGRRRLGPAWAARGEREKERVGPKSAERPRRGFFELFEIKQFVKCCFNY